MENRGSGSNNGIYSVLWSRFGDLNVDAMGVGKCGSRNNSKWGPRRVNCTCQSFISRECHFSLDFATRLCYSINIEQSAPGSEGIRNMNPENGRHSEQHKYRNLGCSVSLTCIALLVIASKLSNFLGLFDLVFLAFLIEWSARTCLNRYMRTSGSGDSDRTQARPRTAQSQVHASRPSFTQNQTLRDQESIDVPAQPKATSTPSTHPDPIRRGPTNFPRTASRAKSDSSPLVNSLEGSTECRSLPETNRKPDEHDSTPKRTIAKKDELKPSTPPSDTSIGSVSDQTQQTTADSKAPSGKQTKPFKGKLLVVPMSTNEGVPSWKIPQEMLHTAQEFQPAKNKARSRKKSNVAARVNRRSRLIEIGDRVTYSDIESKEEFRLTIITTESDPDAGLINCETVVAKALLGQMEGSSLMIPSPSGAYPVKVLRIEKDITVLFETDLRNTKNSRLNLASDNTLYEGQASGEAWRDFAREGNRWNSGAMYDSYGDESEP